jgi:hypothetical protein
MTALEQEKFSQVITLFVAMDKTISQFQMQKNELVKVLYELKFQDNAPILNPKPNWCG